MNTETVFLIVGGVTLVAWALVLARAIVKYRRWERSVLEDDARRSRVLKAVAAAEYRERTKDSRMH